MKTISLTEFNQNPSRATRLADEDEVIIMRRGSAAYRLVRIADEPTDPVEALVRAGLLAPPRNARRATERRTASTTADVGAALDEDRARLDG